MNVRYPWTARWRTYSAPPPTCVVVPRKSNHVHIIAHRRSSLACLAGAASRAELIVAMGIMTLVMAVTFRRAVAGDQSQRVGDEP